MAKRLRNRALAAAHGDTKEIVCGDPPSGGLEGHALQVGKAIVDGEGSHQAHRASRAPLAIASARQLMARPRICMKAAAASMEFRRKHTPTVTQTNARTRAMIDLRSTARAAGATEAHSAGARVTRT